MKVALTLLAYALAVSTLGTYWLRHARWVDRAPRLGLLTWQVLSVSVIVSAAFAGLAVAVPITPITGDLADLLHACVMALQAQYATPGGAAVGVTGTVLTTCLLGRVGYCLARTWRSNHRERRRHLRVLAMISRPDPANGALIIDHQEASAYCLPGRRGRIVLTSTARATLGDDELRAVLAHERAHLRARHDLAVTAATALALAFPRIPVLATARDEIARLAELAADDTASRTVGRLPLAEALLAVADPHTPAPALAATGSHTGRRIRRLLDPAAPLGALRVALAFGLAAAVLAFPVGVAVQPAIAAQHLNYCPIAEAPQGR